MEYTSLHRGYMKTVFFLAVSLVAVGLSGCGRTVGRAMTAIGVGPSDVKAQEFVEKTRTSNLKHISIQSPEEPRELKLTPERAEILKKNLEATRDYNQKRGLSAAQEGLE